MVDNAEKKIIEKMKLQWATVGKAFKTINSQKTGKISNEELRFFINHWGMKLTDE